MIRLPILSIVLLSGGLLTAAHAAPGTQAICEKKIAELKSTLTKNPDKMDAWHELRACANETKNWNAALEIAMLVKTKDPNNPQPRIIMGMGQMHGKDYERAIEHFDKAIELDSRQPFAYFQLGMAYLFLNQTDKALIAAERAVEMEPDNSAYNRQAAYAYLLMEQLDPAERAAKKAVSIDPDDVAALKILAKVYAKEGKSIESSETADLARAAAAKKAAANPVPPPPPVDASAKGADDKEEKLDDADIIAAMLNTWEQMKSSMLAGNIQRGLTYFSTYPGTREQYGDSFARLGVPRVRKAFSSIGEPYDCEVVFLVSSCKAPIKNDHGTVRVTKIRFERNPDKVWRIRSF